MKLTLRTASLICLSVLTVACDSESESASVVLDGALDLGENFSWTIGAFDRVDQPGSVFFAPGPDGFRTYFDQNGEPMAEEDVEDAVPFRVDHTDRAEKTRGDNPIVSVYPNSAAPGGYDSDVLFFANHYTDFIWEDDIRDAVGIYDDSLQILNWTDDVILVRFTSETGEQSHFFLFLDWTGAVYATHKPPLEENQKLHCIGRDGRGTPIFSEISEGYQRIWADNAFLSDSGFSITYYNTESMVVSCVDNKVDGPKVVISYPSYYQNSRSTVFYQDTAEWNKILAEGQHQFSWGANTNGDFGYDAIQFHDGSLFYLTDDHNFHLHHMSYNFETGKVCWIGGEKEGSQQLTLECRDLTSLREAAVKP